jgi:hypothetical protein
MLLVSKDDEEPFTLDFGATPKLSEAERKKIMQRLEDSPMAALSKTKTVPKSND